MPKTDAAKTVSKLPKDATRVINAIRKLVPSTDADKALKFWDIGDRLRTFRSRDTGIRLKEVAQGAGISARQLRYCAEVREAFTSDELERLVENGLRWSTIRELAGESLEPHRESLIAEFESGDCSNAELRDDVLALRRHPPGTEAGNGNRDALVRRTAKRVTSRCAKLQEDLIKAGSDFRDETTVAKDQDGPLSPDTIDCLRAMNTALRELLIDTDKLLLQSGAVTGGEDGSVPAP